MRYIRHKVYNPKMQSLESVLTTEPIESDWMFIKVVPVNEYEYVAVFEKLDFYEDPTPTDGVSSPTV